MLVKKRSEVRRKRIRLIVLISLLVLLIGGSVYVFEYSSLFKVRGIEVSVTGGTSGTALTAADILNGRQYTNMLAPFPSIDAANFPYISNFTVTKNYLKRTVYIKAVARQRDFIWCMTSTGNCYWTDDSGFVFDTAPQTVGGDLMVVEDSSNRDINIGDYALSADSFKNFVADINVLSQLNIPISSIRISNIDYQEMTVVTGGGPEIYFGFTFDPVASGDDTVIKTLAGSPDWSKYCYVDLRTMYKAYTSKSCS